MNWIDAEPVGRLLTGDQPLQTFTDKFTGGRRVEPHERLRLDGSLVHIFIPGDPQKSKITIEKVTGNGLELTLSQLPSAVLECSALLTQKVNVGTDPFTPASLTIGHRDHPTFRVDYFGHADRPLASSEEPVGIIRDVDVIDCGFTLGPSFRTRFGGSTDNQGGYMGTGNFFAKLQRRETAGWNGALGLAIRADRDQLVRMAYGPVCPLSIAKEARDERLMDFAFALSPLINFSEALARKGTVRGRLEEVLPAQIVQLFGKEFCENADQSSVVDIAATAAYFAYRRNRTQECQHADKLNVWPVLSHLQDCIQSVPNLKA